MMNKMKSLITRRNFLYTGGILTAGASTGIIAGKRIFEWGHQAEVFIGKAAHYHSDLRGILLAGMKELGVSATEIKGKKILLKPNMVEPHDGSSHINTNPLLVRAAAETFLALGASKVVIGEGAGHQRDFYLVLEESGMGEVVGEDKLPCVDLNQEIGKPRANLARWTSMKELYFPALLDEMDWVVSVAKMKTHHWAGITLSMKNFFGIMPGIYYGWPKNVLHFEGIPESIIDINATLKPNFAIVDGIVGMEGDGPIMGDPKKAGVLVMGRNLPAVDATCARIMGVDPTQIFYLELASGRLGPILERNIRQRGESIADVQTPFKFLDKTPFTGLETTS